MKLVSDEFKGERIAKVLARAGLCSRREAERWIHDGRVRVNGNVLTSPAINITSDDTVLIDNQALPKNKTTRLWRYHKPPGLITTNKDPKGRTTIFERLPKGLPRIMTVGRLDIRSEGLLLLTNDGEFAQKLELPKSKWIRRYRVRVYGPIVEDRLSRLVEGITVDGVNYGSIQATVESKKRANAWLDVRLREGKNREIRKVLGSLGLEVSRLIRIAYGPFQLGNMGRGQVIEVNGKVMREQISSLGKPKSTNWPIE